MLDEKGVYIKKTMCTIFVTDKTTDKTTIIDEVYLFKKRKLGYFSYDKIEKLIIEMEEIL